MNAYELTVSTNHLLIRGDVLTEAQKESIASELLSAKNGGERANVFLSRANQGRCMYPIYFVPPYNDGKTYKTLLGQTPKTQILSANAYELEILRLLSLLSPDKAREMTENTLIRLKTTCFGYLDDGVGECFDASLVVLRYLAAVSPSDKAWIQSRIDNYVNHYAEKKRTSFCVWYYRLCLSELPFETAKPETDKVKDEMLSFLCEKSLVMHSERDRLLHPTLFYILRNNISRYAEYEYIRNRRPFIDERDGNLHFDMNK